LPGGGKPFKTKGDVNVGDSKDMKILEEYSKITIPYLNECQVVHFQIGGEYTFRKRSGRLLKMI